LVPSTITVMTWNLWGRLGPWQDRQRAIVATLRSAQPDVVLLQETWVERGGRAQTQVLAAELGYHEVHGGDTFLFSDDWAVAFGVLSRWPVIASEVRQFDSPQPDTWGGAAMRAEIGGPRGTIAAFSVAFDWPIHASATRQASARQLVEFVRAMAGGSAPLLIGGDLNATPDSDEVRSLTGRRVTPAPGFALRDAWEAAEHLQAGNTWAADNPWAAPALLPSRRIDYLLVGPPGPGGVGHVTACRLDGSEPVAGIVPSDHYAVTATVRY
jgi:endonuclease/exonuclease/phosphatase family metal-dependent hydrolase